MKKTPEVSQRTYRTTDNLVFLTTTTEIQQLLKEHAGDEQKKILKVFSWSKILKEMYAVLLYNESMKII